MRFITLVLVALLFVLEGCSTNLFHQNVIIKDVQPPKVIPLETAKTKPIQFKRVMRVDEGQVIGTWNGGLLCVPNGNILWKRSFGETVRLFGMWEMPVNIDSDEFTEVFQDELKKYNFKTVGDTSALSEEPSKSKSEILVTGRVTDLKTNVCYPKPPFGLVNGKSQGNAYIKVEWLIYSKLDRKVVYTLDADGDGKQTEAIEDGYKLVILKAFAESVQKLLADTKFRNIVMQQDKSITKREQENR